jgi:hypothetical protein
MDYLKLFPEYSVQHKAYTVLNAVFNNRYMKMLPVIAILTLFSWGIDANAQCMTGFTPMSITIEVNGCDYQVNLCVKCYLGSGPSAGEIMIRDITQILSFPPCVQEWQFQYVLNYINNHISTYDFIQSNLCFSVNAPPCPEQSEVYTFYRPLCLNIERISHLGIDHIVYTPCDDNTCIESFTYCFQAFPPPATIIKTRTDGPTMTGPVNCFMEATIDIPDEYNQPTECYIYHSPCNP